MNDQKSLYARFTGPQIFAEQGRLLFSLMHVFANSGYRIELHHYLGDQPLEKYGQMIHGIPSLSLTDQPPEHTEASYYLYDRIDARLARLPWRKRIQVRFDLFSPFWFSNPIIMPFPMHPMQSALRPEDLQALRGRVRRMRIFFSGDTVNYHRVRVPYPKPKLPRQKIVDAIKARLGEPLQLVDSASELAELLQGPYADRCVLTASSEVRIEFADWLPTLASADFFLSPPGIIMPMCHNIIEAMAVGTIPITNYPEWMDPPLQHMQNCIAFEDEDDLIGSLRQALAMPPDEIGRLRTNVLDYYQTHLRPETFVQRVEASPDRDLPILMYTEGNMYHNPKKLGRSSILIQGTAHPRPQGWLRRMAACYLG